MLKSSVLDIFRTFSKADLVDFGNFVVSPFHNKNTNAVKLFNTLKNFHPEFNSQVLSKEELWKKIYVGKRYNYGVMKNLIHELTKLTESYLSLRAYNNGFNHDKFLIQELFKRGLYDNFLNKLEKFKKNNKPGLIDFEDYFYNRVFADRMMHKYAVNRGSIVENKIETYQIIIEYFLDTILRFAYGIYTEVNRVNIKHEYPFITFLMQYIDQNQAMLGDNDFIKMKYYSVLSFTTDDPEEALQKIILHFNKLKRAVLSKDDTMAAYVYVLAIFENLFLRGIKKFGKDCLLHMIEMVEKEIYKNNEKDYLDTYSFTGVMTLAERTGESIIAKKFIHDNIHRVSDDLKADILNYSLSRVSFIEKDYGAALEYSSKINVNNFFNLNKDNIYHKLSNKRLVSICHYELEHFEELLYEIDASIHFVKNNTLFTERTKVSAINFFKILKKVTLLRSNYDASKAEEILQSVVMHGNGMLFHKEWLIEKLSNVNN